MNSYLQIKMKEVNVITKFLGLGAVALSTVVSAAEELHSDDNVLQDVRENVWASANIDFMSKYVWRGTIMNDRPCWQPGAYLGYRTEDYGGVYGGVWSSMDLTHHVNNFGGCGRHNCGMQELDYYLAYTKSFGSFDFELGHWFYTYPNDNYPDYNEVFLSSYYNNEFITPGMEVWWAYQNTSDLDPTFWFKFILKHDFKFFDESLSITPKASLAFGDASHTRLYVVDWKGDGSDGNGAQLTDQTTSLIVAYTITPNVSIGGNVNYTWIPSRTLQDERWMTYGHDGRCALVWGGVTVSVSF